MIGALVCVLIAFIPYYLCIRNWDGVPGKIIRIVTVYLPVALVICILLFS